jgi:hypothetical protein
VIPGTKSCERYDALLGEGGIERYCTKLSATGTSVSIPCLASPTKWNELMTATEFLSRWMNDHINGNTKQTDAGKLYKKLVSDAALEGIDHDSLEVVAGRKLDSYVSDAIWMAVEEEMYGSLRPARLAR